MITRKTKIGVISAGIFATTAVTTVTAINMARADESDKIFVQLDGQTFTSRNKLTEYVKSMADMQTFNTGETAFTINVGQNSLMFTNATQASRYVEEYFTTNFTAYLKPNHEEYIDPLTGIISSEGYYKASNIFFNTYKTNNGGYTFALKGDVEANEKAKQEAAESYITMHNAYRWNGIYFNNEVSLERYLRTEIDSVDRVDMESTPTFINEAGVPRTVDFNDPNDVASFERWVANASYPNVEYQPGEYTRLESDNLLDIATQSMDELYSYMPITSNNNEVTKIVDISNTTETGSLYGSYMVTSGSSTTSIHEKNNWERSKADVHGFNGYSGEIEKISSMINSMFMEFSNNEDVLLGFVTEYKPYGKNLFDIIKPIQSQTLDFIADVGSGQRGTLFNSVYALYSYVINQIISVGESKEMIDEFTEYMNEIARYMDGKAAATILPFINGVEEEDGEIKIKFFEEIYSFGERGFQDNIDSYWRTIEEDEEHGLSTIKDLMIMTYDIGSLAAISIKANDDIIDNHIKRSGYTNGDWLINLLDRTYANEIIDIQYRTLTNHNGINNLSASEIYENIDYVISNIYGEAIDKYFYDLIGALVDDPTMFFYEMAETSSEFYLGMDIITNEDWKDIKTRDEDTSDEKWANREKTAETLGSTLQYIFENKLYKAEGWYETFVPDTTEELASMTFKFLDTAFALLGVLSGGAGAFIYSAIKTIINTVISMLPEATFSGSREHVYSYFDQSTESTWHWDGGLESWTWWGIGGKDTIGLESLSMIVTDNIVDGFSVDQYYYDGEKYDSVTSAKVAELSDMLDEMNLEKSAHFTWDVEREHVLWETPFAGKGTLMNTTIQDTLDELQDEDNRFEYSEDFYNIDGNLTNDVNEIVEAEIEKWLSTIKPIIIIQLPTLLPNGEYMKNEFDLPKPRYTDSGFEAYDGNNPEVEIVDTNINIEILNEGLANGIFEQEFVDLMIDLVNTTEGDMIDRVFDVYSDQISPQIKTVLFDVMNDQGEKMIFDDLSENTQIAMLSEVKFKDGSIHTFYDKVTAVDNLLSSDNYDYSVVDISRYFEQYTLNEYSGSTINALIDDIIRRNEGSIHA